MTKFYDATKEFKPFARSADYNGKHPRSRVRQALNRQAQGHRHIGPNVRVQGQGNNAVKLAAGGTVTLSCGGRKNGNGAFFRLRDGACVSHVLA